MLATDAQVRRLHLEFSKHGKIGLASIRAGLDRKTGRKYVKSGKLPSETGRQRDWRTRKDPFEADWQDIEEKLADAPALEAKTLFGWICERRPNKYQEGQLRTLQRRVREWRALHGPPKEVFFAQEHRPGEAMQTDFTSGNELGITINGEAFPHLLCHPVLPYSNWEWVTVCRSESIPALRCGVQSASFKLGRVPEFHQTDNSTAATHKVAGGKRDFNDAYLALMDHLGMKPRTTQVGEKEQNGDVESLHGSLKRALKQHLLLRENYNFGNVKEYEQFLQDIVQKRNCLRSKRIEEDLAAMTPLAVKRLPDYVEEKVRVSTWSTIRVRQNSYSVPSRLKDEILKVRIHDDRLEVYYKGAHQMSVERLLGKKQHRINYRHIIWSLVKKPGAFKRYKYREDLFPTLTFRIAYDVLSEKLVSTRDADLHYLRILHLAASTMETDVETALELLLDQGETPLVESVKALVVPREPEIPHMELPPVDLAEYDTLLEMPMEAAQ